MPRKARRRSTCRASSESWRASGNGIGMIGLRLGIARFRCPKSGLSRFHAGVISSYAVDIEDENPWKNDQYNLTAAVFFLAESLFRKKSNGSRFGGVLL